MSFNVSYLVGLLISCIFDRSTCSKRSKESLRRNLSFCRLDSILLSLVFLTFFVSGKKHLLRFSDLYVKSSILYTAFPRIVSFLNLTLCTVTFVHSTYRCGNYSREETIQGRKLRKLYEEIRYIVLQ